MAENKQSTAEKIKQLLNEIAESNNETYTRLLDELCGTVESKHFDLLRKELKHENYRRRMAAAAALGRKRDDKSNDCLLELLDDPVGDVREAAIIAVSMIGREGNANRLIELVSDPKPAVRKAILNSLAELNYNLLEVVLIRAMNDVNKEVRKTAIKHLRRFGTAKCGGCALRALLDNDYEMQMYAEQVLDRILHNFTDANYVLINEGLSLRERRLIITYLESRYLQFVYPRLYEALHSGGTPTDQPNIINLPDQKDVEELCKYGRILNIQEEFDSLLTAYQREELVEQITNDYIRGTAQSVIFVGPSGVGKTAIIHSIAKNLITLQHRKKSKNLLDKWYVLETSTTELITETRYLGEWESKLKKMLSVIDSCSGHVLIYLTNPNDLLGAGTHSNSEENFADFFRPYLLRGDVIFVTETTQEELNNGLAHEPGFLRLFKQIQVNPLTATQTKTALADMVSKNDFEMLRRMVNKPEKRDEDGTVNLHEGINTIDTASFFNSINSKAKKQRLRPFKSLKVSASPPMIDAVIHLSKSFIPSTVMPGAAATLLEEVIDLKISDIEAKLRNGSFEESENGKLEEEIVIEFEDITRTLSKKSGLPLSLIDPNVPLDLEGIRKFFTDRLIGQPEPIEELLNRLAMIKAGVNNPNRPLAVYFLVGPTGVGKTFFAKLVAEYLFGDPERLVRLDLSEYQAPYDVPKIIGTQTSSRLTGFEDGILTSAIRNQPYSVILLDEFEKGHRDIYSLFLQVFDEARITDGRGKTLDLRQTIILITSNLGAVRDGNIVQGFGEEDYEDIRRRIISKMRKFFAPEFINRLDKVIPFDALTEKSIDALIDVEIERVEKRRGFSAHGYKISLEPDAREWLKKNGFSKDYGARHLLRAVEQNLLPAAARLIVDLSNQKAPNSVISVRCRRAEDPDYGGYLHAEWSEKIPPNDNNDNKGGDDKLALAKQQEISPNNIEIEPPSL